MLRSTIVLFALTSFAVAAPVPKESERQKIEKLYGKIVDPKGDSKFALDGDKLKITLPANETRSFSYTTDPDDPKNSAKYKKTNDTPRVEFTAKGDFVLTVRITLEIDAEAVTSGESLCLGGGVQLIPKNGDWVRSGYGRANVLEATKLQNLMPHEGPRMWGKHGFSSCSVIEDSHPDSFVFEVTRIGDTAVFRVSPDRKKWYARTTYSGHFPDDELKLTLFAQHSSNKSRSVTFSDFEIKPIEKK